MTHPILDCGIHPKEGAEAHYDKLKEDLEAKRVKILDMVENNFTTDRIAELAELVADVQIIKEYLAKEKILF